MRVPELPIARSRWDEHLCLQYSAPGLVKKINYSTLTSNKRRRCQIFRELLKHKFRVGRRGLAVVVVAVSVNYYFVVIKTIQGHSIFS